jgi:phosphoglycolate phosphatase
MARRYSLIVFDWDGTLIDSASAIATCIQEAAREMGLPVPDRERASHVIGLGLHDSLRHAVPELPLEGYPRFIDCYRRHFLNCEDSMQLFPGMLELLACLRDRGHLLAIATGKSRRGLQRALDLTGLGAHFHATRCADETHPKPHPAMLIELLEELAIEPRESLMIGDTSHDLEMARAAGVGAVAVCYGAHPEPALRALSPLACVASVVELVRWLEQNGLSATRARSWTRARRRASRSTTSASARRRSCCAFAAASTPISTAAAICRWNWTGGRASSSTPKDAI